MISYNYYLYRKKVCLSKNAAFAPPPPKTWDPRRPCTLCLQEIKIKRLYIASGGIVLRQYSSKIATQAEFSACVVWTHSFENISIPNILYKIYLFHCRVKV